jgi:hypothetical protein
MWFAYEIEALWFAQIEAARRTPGTAGVPPAFKDDPRLPGATFS